MVNLIQKKLNCSWMRVRAVFRNHSMLFATIAPEVELQLTSKSKASLIMVNCEAANHLEARTCQANYIIKVSSWCSQAFQEEGMTEQIKYWLLKALRVLARECHSWTVSLSHESSIVNGCIWKDTFSFFQCVVIKTWKTWWASHVE